MNCQQLRGACNQEFHANTFEEIAELSKVHAMGIFSYQIHINWRITDFCKHSILYHFIIVALHHLMID